MQGSVGGGGTTDRRASRSPTGPLAELFQALELRRQQFKPILLLPLPGLAGSYPPRTEATVGARASRKYEFGSSIQRMTSP